MVQRLEDAFNTSIGETSSCHEEQTECSKSELNALKKDSSNLLDFDVVLCHILPIFTGLGWRPIVIGTLLEQ